MRFILIVLFCSNLLLASEHSHYYSKDFKYLELKNGQKSQIKDILKEYRKNIKAFREHKEEMTKAKQKLFEQDNFDENKLEQINQEINNFSSHVETKLLKRIHTILTKKQRKKFINYIDEWEIE